MEGNCDEFDKEIRKILKKKVSKLPFPKDVVTNRTFSPETSILSNGYGIELEDLRKYSSTLSYIEREFSSMEDRAQDTKQIGIFLLQNFIPFVYANILEASIDTWIIFLKALNLSYKLLNSNYQEIIIKLFHNVYKISAGYPGLSSIFTELHSLLLTFGNLPDYFFREHLTICNILLHFHKAKTNTEHQINANIHILYILNIATTLQKLEVSVNDSLLAIYNCVKEMITNNINDSLIIPTLGLCVEFIRLTKCEFPNFPQLIYEIIERNPLQNIEFPIVSTNPNDLFHEIKSISFYLNQSNHIIGKFIELTQLLSKNSIFIFLKTLFKSNDDELYSVNLTTLHFFFLYFLRLENNKFIKLFKDTKITLPDLFLNKEIFDPNINIFESINNKKLSILIPIRFLEFKIIISYSTLFQIQQIFISFFINTNISLVIEMILNMNQSSLTYNSQFIDSFKFCIEEKLRIFPDNFDMFLQILYTLLKNQVELSKKFPKVSFSLRN